MIVARIKKKVVLKMLRVEAVQNWYNLLHLAAVYFRHSRDHRFRSRAEDEHYNYSVAV